MLTSPRGEPEADAAGVRLPVTTRALKAEDLVRVRNHVIAFASDRRPSLHGLQGRVGHDAVPAGISLPWTPVVPEGLDFCTIPANVLDQYNLAKARSFSKPGFRTKAPAMRQGSTVAGVTTGDRPAKSATGRPILANDPHGSSRCLRPLYITHVSAPGLNFIGGELNAPGFLIGYTALGATLFFMAQEDLYVYDTHPDDPPLSLRSGWEAMWVVHETIAVGRGCRDVELKFTRHGPIIMETRRIIERTRWATRLDAGGAPYMGGRYLGATNTDQVAAALKHWGEPTLNTIVADTKGKIGWFPSGFVPKRPNTDGLLPLPGDGRYEWDGYLDHDLLPSEVDPSRGYIVTANHMNLPAGYPYKDRRISFFWIDDSRFNRITEVLEGLPKVSVGDAARLQNDYVTFPGRRLVRLLGTVAESSPPNAGLREGDGSQAGMPTCSRGGRWRCMRWVGGI
jgi:penicillin amidase